MSYSNLSFFSIITNFIYSRSSCCSFILIKSYNSFR
nr:MAG TPA: hypothetical protein [Caudoviricetes sp.]